MRAGEWESGRGRRRRLCQHRPEVPKTLVVGGGGVIGVEYASMFAALGVRVILIEKRPRLLEFADSEMIEALCYHLRDSRVTLRLGEEVASVGEHIRDRSNDR